jgi:hypothetical protein
MKSVLGLTLAILVAVILAGLCTYWAYPKKITMDVHPSYTGYYRGFGLDDSQGFFGKRFAKVLWQESDGYGICWTKKDGYNPYKRWYDNGSIRGEGECLVLISGWKQPMVDWNDLKWANCYRPDGSVGSEVRDGTGIQTIWSEPGVKIWELELKDYKRVQLKQWYPSGALAHSISYKDGEPHGLSISYYEDGHKRLEAAYSNGKRCGKWVFWSPDGSVDRIESYELDSDRVVETQ